MEIVIIDDGVSGEAVSCPVICYKASGGKIRLEEDGGSDVSVRSHGSLCARIISKGIFGLTLISIKIYEEEDKGTYEDLLAALIWCIGKPVDLINISNGYTDYYANTGINEACYKLWEQGTAVVAALYPWGAYTVPANLPYVAGVERRGIGFEEARRLFRADMRENGLTLWRNKDNRIRLGNYNSVACARACRKLAKRKLYGPKRPLSRVYRLAAPIYDFSQMKDMYIFGTDVRVPDYLLEEIEIYDVQALDGNRFNLAIVGRQITDTLMKELKSVKGRLNCLICCQPHIPGRLLSWCISNRVRYWDESLIPASDRDVQAEIKVPVIVVCNGQRALRLARELAHYMEKDGYGALTLSPVRYSYLLGFQYCRNAASVPLLYHIYDPDAMIIADMCDSQPVDGYDIYIRIDGDGLCVTSEEGTRRIPDDSLSLYHAVLAMLLPE